MPISLLNIVLCFNEEADALILAKKLKEISPHFNFLTSPSFVGLLKVMTSVPEVHYFIIEESYKECKAIDFIEKLKSSIRYKKSLISLFSPNLENVDQKFRDLKLNFYFDQSFSLQKVNDGLEKSFLKTQIPLIPKAFNILAIDDDAGILELIQIHLAELGHTKIELCSNVSDAKNKLLNGEFDMLLLDWNLGDGSCIDIMNYIKENPLSERTKNALTMVITGRNDIDDIMTLLRYGVKDTIIKPFDFLEFEEKISYALEKHFQTSTR
jgi:CheY-like chemotaxis protein